MSNSVCEGCGAPLDQSKERCPYCGQINPLAVEQNNQLWLPAWTQGISKDGIANGSYDLVEYPAMPLVQALQFLKRLPIPPDVKDPGNYCPPALGFDERNISRCPDGSYYLWPEDRACSLSEAVSIVRQIYSVTGR